jgi:hypothetical protein
VCSVVGPRVALAGSGARVAVGPEVSADVSTAVELGWVATVDSSIIASSSFTGAPISIEEMMWR